MFRKLLTDLMYQDCNYGIDFVSCAIRVEKERFSGLYTPLHGMDWQRALTTARGNDSLLRVVQRHGADLFEVGVRLL